MDAKRAGFAVTLFLSIICASCVPPDGGFNAHPSAKSASDIQKLRQSPQSQPTTGNADSAANDAELQRVEQFIARIDEMSVRVNRNTPQGPNPVNLAKGTDRPIAKPNDPPATQPSSTQLPPETANDDRIQNPTSSPTNGYVSTNAGAQAEEQSPTVESPVLGAIDVHAAPPATKDDVHSSPSSDNAVAAPGINKPATASNAPVTLEQLIEQWQSQPGEGSYREQLDQRLVLVVAGKYEEARRPLESVSDQQRQMAARLIEMLIEIRESHGGSPESEAKRVLTEVQALSDTLVQVSDPEITVLALTRAVRGFGQYEPFDPAEFPSGRQNEFVVYCELRNFVSRENEGWYASEFAMKTTILNRSGDVILEINDDPIKDRCRSRRHDCFIPRLVRLPATISPGEYVVKLTIIDKIGEKVTEKRTTFRIVARS